MQLAAGKLTPTAKKHEVQQLVVCGDRPQMMEFEVAKFVSFLFLIGHSEENG